jgi:hypothetical protein
MNAPIVLAFAASATVKLIQALCIQVGTHLSLIGRNNTELGNSHMPDTVGENSVSSAAEISLSMISEELVASRFVVDAILYANKSSLSCSDNALNSTSMRKFIQSWRYVSVTISSILVCKEAWSRNDLEILVDSALPEFISLFSIFDVLSLSEHQLDTALTTFVKSHTDDIVKFSVAGIKKLTEKFVDFSRLRSRSDSIVCR